MTANGTPTQPFRVVRSRHAVLLPTRIAARPTSTRSPRDIGADMVFVDPWLPLGRARRRRLRAAPYVVVVHGAEVTVPGRLPGSRRLGRRVLRGAAAVVAAGEYPAREAVHAARRPLPGVVVPPGVDVERFRPLDADARGEGARVIRSRSRRVPLVVGVSRLVPRKGFDVLIDAMARHPRCAPRDRRRRP